MHSKTRPACKYWEEKMNDSNKHTSLLRYGIDYGLQSFILLITAIIAAVM